jgi:hypothetical protein
MSPSATLHCVKSNNERNGRNVFAKVAMGLSPLYPIATFASSFASIASVFELCPAAQTFQPQILVNPRKSRKTPKPLGNTGNNKFANPVLVTPPQLIN